MSNCFRLGLVTVLVLSIPAGSSRADKTPAPMLLWPKGAPGEKGDIGEEKQLPLKAGDTTIRITNVTRPTITLFRPPAEKDTGAAVLICPGGGYGILAF